MVSKGIVYIVDKVFGELLIISLHSLFSSSRTPELLSVTVYTLDFDFQDLSWSPPVGRVHSVRVPPIFEGIALGEDSDRRHRLTRAIVLAKLSPYDITLSLDADTMVCQDVSPVFDLLEESACLVGAVPEPHSSDLEPLEFFFREPLLDKCSAFERVSQRLDVRYPFLSDLPYFNCGILCSKKGPWADDWLSILARLCMFPDVNACDDQLPFKAALVRTNTTPLILSPTWNCAHHTTSLPGLSVAKENGQWVMRHPGGSVDLVRICHGIGAIHFLKSLLYFPLNLEYALYADRVYDAWKRQ